jgi:hypothetical protein
MEGPPKFTQICFFCLKTYHLATMVARPKDKMDKNIYLLFCARNKTKSHVCHVSVSPHGVHKPGKLGDKTKQQKTSTYLMTERCRTDIPVSLGNRGNKTE